MTKYKGGLYVWRVDKPHAVIGLPFIGRHFGYCGMTNSYYFREKQRLEGSVKYGTTPYSWSDLRPKRYKILPLPAHWLKSNHRIRRRIVRGLETVMIGVLCPVYNDTQQSPWNLRKISKAKAAAQRKLRDEIGFAAKATKFVVRMAFWAALFTVVLAGFAQGWWTA